MAQPIVWPKKTFFYPIGNTPPVCLTQGLSPGKGAEVLLLGCGDPRSILYTIHSDLSPNGRDMDFTCCDWEPAILARNIILLTMIYDGVAPCDVWPIFYHMCLDDHSYDMLRVHCRMLLQVSTDLKAWKNSKYGKFLKFCTERSLLDIRGLWEQYLGIDDLTPTEKKALKDNFTSAMKKRSGITPEMNYGIIRSAGPLVISIIPVAFESYSSFWATGTISSKLGISGASHTPHINPTFVFSLAGKAFNVHIGTHPILAFHMAPVLAVVKKGSITVEDLGDHARLQFSTWCTAFKDRLTSNARGDVIIRFFAGDALAFCQALRNVKVTQSVDTGVYASAWGATQIIFEPGDYGETASSPKTAPLSFNIIDTSNLADHVGLLNLLVSVLPLLQPKPTSIIHTNTLLRTDSSGAATTGLPIAACADIATLSVMLGITPLSHTTHFTTHSNKHEILVSHVVSGQILEPISWRFNSDFIPNSVYKRADNVDTERPMIVCDDQKLGDFLFSVYMRVFDCDDQMKNFENINISTAVKMINVRYVRASFAAFLSHIKENISAMVNWTATMHRLIELIGNDKRLIMGASNFQDLLCHFFLRNVHTVKALDPDWVESLRTCHDRLHGWESVPAVVCIVLKVPRKHLMSLEAMGADEIELPVLQCETSSASFHNVHSTLQMCFGDIDVSRVDGRSNVVIQEDRSGWGGKSDLIVTFHIPAWILTVAPKTTTIGLYIRVSPHAMMRIAPKLGKMLTIYSTSLSNTTNVQVVPHRPQNPHEMEYLRRKIYPQKHQATQSERTVRLKFDSLTSSASTLTVRENIKPGKASYMLQNGAKVLAQPMGDCTFHITFDKYVYRLPFPYPIRCSLAKTRIARSSSYIEVEAPLRNDFSDSLDLSLNPFAVYNDDKDVNLLNIHYINLDVLPSVPVQAPPDELGWVSVHTGLMFSRTEKAIRDEREKKMRGALINLKASIGAIFIKHAGLQLQHRNEQRIVFGLCNPDVIGVHTLIFVNGLKFDLANHAVVVDACVVPLYSSILDKLDPGLQFITNAGVMQVITLSDEARAWVLLLPSLAERCRTWEHRDACEYRKKGIPIALECTEVSPLCSCGKGKNLGAFGAVPGWAPFRDEATRVAIGPLFSHSFLHPNEMFSPPTSSVQCRKCGGPGKPALQRCTVCKSAQYCSRECQKADWKTHKMTCTAN